MRKRTRRHVDQIGQLDDHLAELQQVSAQLSMLNGLIEGAHKLGTDTISVAHLERMRETWRQKSADARATLMKDL